MSLPPENIEAGKCYVTEDGEERPVIEAAYGKLTYLVGRQQTLWKLLPRRHVMTRGTFAAQAVREVPCSHDKDFRLRERL